MIFGSFEKSITFGLVQRSKMKKSDKLCGSHFSCSFPAITAGGDVLFYREGRKVFYKFSDE